MKREKHTAQQVKFIERNRKKISSRLVELRKARYDSAEKFAYDNELNRVNYWRVESGKYNYTIDTLLRILAIHKISLEEFFKRMK